MDDAFGTDAAPVAEADGDPSEPAALVIDEFVAVAAYKALGGDFVMLGCPGGDSVMLETDGQSVNLTLSESATKVVVGNNVVVTFLIGFSVFPRRLPLYKGGNVDKGNVVVVECFKDRLCPREPGGGMGGAFGYMARHSPSCQ